MDENKPLGLLEPHAEALAKQLHGLVMQGEKISPEATISPMLTSIAISLKRLADTLELTTGEVAGGRARYFDCRNGGDV